jgi:Trypsin-like peptidase domain
MCELTGDDIAKLGKELAGALDFDSLDEFVYASTGDRLFVEYVGEGKPLRPTIVALLNALQERGTPHVFLRYVYVRRPGKPALRQLIAALCPEAATEVVPEQRPLSVQEGGRAQANAPTNALAPGLQRNVRPYLSKLDVRVWVDRLISTQRRVCRIERGGNAMGTGFLVGPDTLLTNWHVVKGVQAEGKLADVGCRFDYVKLADDAQSPGQLVPLRPDGCLAFSPYSAAEATDHPDNPAPKAEELDFALLRLETTAGQQMVEGSTRGWMVLPTTAFPLPPDSPLLILQHPEGQPMKLAMDTQAVIGPNGNGTRIKYRTNTDPGSSGSPCFTMDWDLVALHHYGDPRWQAPLFNQGVPINLIRQRIEAQGFANALGA